jgi:hypothetical protein
MKSVDIDRNTGDLILGPGNRGSDVDPKLRSENIMFPMGRCPAVAVSGLTLGGGWSMYARHYGMACDSLLETTLVTPDARILTCSESENADLFWALRGGGGGNFGINTSFRFRTVGVSNTTVFKMIWLFPDKPAQIMEKLLHVAVHAPSTFSLEATAAPATPFPRHGLLLSVAGHMFGSESDVKELMQPAFNAEAPLSSLIWRTSFWNAKEILSDSAPFGFFRHKSAFAGTNVSTSLDMAEMIEWIRQWPATSQVPDAAFGFYSFGGKVNAVSKDETAFVHRSSELLFKFETTWGENDPPEVICATSEWLEKFFEKARAGLSPYSYQNFPDPDLENWANAYYGSNLPRLIKLKQKIDPTNLFHFLQSIPVRMPGAM